MSEISCLQCVRQAIAADVPVLLWGPPGTGKTASITALAHEQGVHLDVLIGSTIDPTDLGRPVVQADGSIKLAPPPWAERIKSQLNAGKPAWLFLDELTSAPPSVQAALLRVVQERQVADISLSGCQIIAAANPIESATDASELSDATVNRWIHIDWETNTDAWCAGELGGWGSPNSSLSAIRALVTSWILQSPSALLEPPKEGAENIRGWPSPRSWTHFVKVLGSPEALKTPIGRKLAIGAVGHAAASEIITWSTDISIPNPIDLLDGKKTLPKRGDKANLAIGSVIAYTIVEQKRLPDMWNLIAKQRTDLAIQSGKKAMAACKAAGLDPAMTAGMKKLIAMIRDLQ